MNFGFIGTIAAMSAMDINETENTSKNNNHQDNRWADLDNNNKKGGFGCFFMSIILLGLIGWGIYSMGFSDPYEREEMCTTTVKHIEKPATGEVVDTLTRVSLTPQQCDK